MPRKPMPPLTGVLRRNADFYGLEWLPDAYPGRRRGPEVWAHPLYGAYALKDYLEQFDQRPSAELRRALRTVARASLARMSSHEGALVFWYDEDQTGARGLERHYSGLTQGYYAVHLARAGQVLGDAALTEASRQVFASLTVPVDRGGVLSHGEAGPVIAELSQEPNSYILNGWQSALAAVARYAALTESTEASQLARDSAREMARLLPLYDAPEYRTSRYGLSGFVYARLIFRGAEPDAVAVRHLRLQIPGGGTMPADRLGGRRWENHVLPQDVQPGSGDVLRPVSNLIRVNLVLSRISFPRPNRLLAEVSGPGGLVEVQLQRGRYDPLTVAQTDRTWVTVARVECRPGTSTVDVPLPWDVAELVAYPTNFAKLLDGQQTNVYHLTHIERLRELAAATGVRELAEWADTWLRYVGEWEDLPIYRDLHLRWGSATVPVLGFRRALPVSSALSGADGQDPDARPALGVEHPAAVDQDA